MTSVGRGVSRSTIEQEGEPDRRGFGIDGTMGDAQDVDHPFLGSVYGAHCRVCGLASTYRRHKELTPLSTPEPVSGACIAHNRDHDCYHQHAQGCPCRTPRDIWEGDGPQVCICSRPGRHP